MIPMRGKRLRDGPAATDPQVEGLTRGSYWLQAPQLILQSSRNSPIGSSAVRNANSVWHGARNLRLKACACTSVS